MTRIIPDHRLVPVFCRFRTHYLTALAALVAIAAPRAFAQNGDIDCDASPWEFVYKITRPLGYATDDIDLLEVACKVWPSRPGTTIVALAHGHPSPEYPEDVTVFDLEVMLVDSQTGRVQVREHWQNVYTSDAIYLASLSIDTARYQLTPSLRAFGLRAGFTGSSRANPYGSEELSLYVEEDGRLRPVLTGLLMSTSCGEWDTNCAGQFVDQDSVLAIGQTRRRGWADLILRTTSKHTVNTQKDGDCGATETSSELPERTLRYDGSQYPVPRDLSGG